MNISERNGKVLTASITAVLLLKPIRHHFNGVRAFCATVTGR